MHNNKSDELLHCLRRYEVPLLHAVALLARLRGVSLNQIARSAGLHRNSLYHALAGRVCPSAGVRETVTRMLGVDPWEIYERSEEDG